MKLIDDLISKRMEILRFPLIVLVVFNHNYASAVRLNHRLEVGVQHNSFWVDFIRFSISHGIAKLAVPMFFVMSGYLFFMGEWSSTAYAGKLKRRLRTLLIPYLFWNLLTLLGYAVALTIPQLRVYFSGEFWPPMHSFAECVNALPRISMMYLVDPISYQFWFIRNLMGLVILAPAIYFLLTRRSALPFIAVLFCWWFFSQGDIFWRFVESALFFSLGAYFSLAHKNVTYLDRFGPWISAVFACFLVFRSAFPDLPFLHKFVLVCGVPSLWWLTKLAAETVVLKSWCVRLSGASFFVYAAHEPLLTLTRKPVYRLLSPTSGAAILTLYFLIPIFLITLLVATYRGLRHTIPSFLAFITGSSYRLNTYTNKSPLILDLPPRSQQFPLKLFIQPSRKR